MTTAVLLTLLPAHGATAQTSPDVWRNFARRVAVGTELNVELNDGHRLRAMLVGADDNAVLLQPKTRIAVPVQAVSYDSIVRMETRKGSSVGKAVAIGVAAGVGTFFGIMAVLFAAVGD
jgi:hypothetical protein